jgi:hypothetical protein
MAADIEADKVKAGGDAKKWLGLVQLGLKNEKSWRNIAEATLSRYADERPQDTAISDRKDRKFNILWANTEILMAHLCVDLGSPDVRKMFTRAGKKTAIAKVAADVLEKVMTTENHAFDQTHEFEQVIEDYLLPGRGVAWLELEAQEDEEGGDDWLEAKIVYVPWTRFVMGLAGHWKEVPWVARGMLFTRKDLEDAWRDDAAEIPLDHIADEGLQTDQNKPLDLSGGEFQRAMVYEVWVKSTGQRIYIAEGYDKILQADDDPYRLKDFFPCGKPLLVMKGKRGLCPVSYYWLYADQAGILDRLTTREYRLSESLKYCGVYGFLGGDGADDQLPNIVDLEDGQFTPIKNAAAWLEKGGLEKAFMVRALEPIALALKGVQEYKDRVIQDIYQVTGIADIMRGQTNPNETFGAQRLKSRFGSHRSSRMQRKVQRFVRDHYRLKAEIIAEHYGRDQLQAMTGVMMPTREEQDKAKAALAQAKQMTQQAQEGQQQAARAMLPPAAPGQQPNPQAAQQAMQAAQAQVPLPQFDQDSLAELQATVAAVAWEDIREVLRSNARRMFMIDVETDSTEFEDEEDAKESALSFLNAFGNVMKEVLPAVQQNPVTIPVMKEATMLVADAFKAGKAFEAAIEEMFDKMSRMPPQPNPAEKGKGQADAAKAQAVQAETRARLQNDMADRQEAQQEHAMTLAARQQNMRQDEQIHRADMQRRMEEITAEREKLQLQLQEAHAKLAAAGLPAQPLATAA